MNILLLQLKRIGDLILTTPAIAALREKFPEATLSLVVAPAVEGLLPAIPGIDKVFVNGVLAYEAGSTSVKRAGRLVGGKEGNLL